MVRGSLPFHNCFITVSSNFIPSNAFWLMLTAHPCVAMDDDDCERSGQLVATAINREVRPAKSACFIQYLSVARRLLYACTRASRVRCAAVRCLRCTASRTATNDRFYSLALRNTE